MRDESAAVPAELADAVPVDAAPATVGCEAFGRTEVGLLAAVVTGVLAVGVGRVGGVVTGVPGLGVPA